MFTIKTLPQFSAWFEQLPDKRVQVQIGARIRRLSAGLFGDCHSVGDGVSELRVHLGAGWRVYFTRRGEQVIVLLAGGSKRSQQADIERAKALARQL